MVSFEQFLQLLYEHGSRNYHMNAAYVRFFKTRKKTDGTVDVRAYSNIGHASRTTPPSQKELNNRNLFAQVNREVGERIKNGDKRNRHVIFHEVYAELKNNTLPSR